MDEIEEKKAATITLPIDVVKIQLVRTKLSLRV